MDTVTVTCLFFRVAPLIMYQTVDKLLNVEAVELQAMTRLTFCDRTIFHLMM